MKACLTSIFSGLALGLIIQANLRNSNLHGTGYEIGKQYRNIDSDMDLKDLHQAVSGLANELDEYDTDEFFEGVQHGYFCEEYQEEILEDIGGEVTQYKGTR